MTILSLSFCGMAGLTVVCEINFFPVYYDHNAWEEGMWRCEIFFFSPSHQNSGTNYFTKSDFYKWGDLLFHLSESPQVGGSRELIQWLHNVTSDPGSCPHTTMPKNRKEIFFFLHCFVFNVFSLFFNPGKEIFLESQQMSTQISLPRSGLRFTSKSSHKME